VQGGDGGDQLALAAGAGAGQLGGDLPEEVRRVTGPAGQPTGLGNRVENGECQVVRGIRVRPESGRVQLAEHLAQRDGRRVAPDQHGHVRGEDRLIADQLARRREGHRRDRAGLQGPGQADGPAGGQRRGDLLRGVVVGEALGEVVGVVVVDHHQRPAGRGEQ
jgi:hypothetical protein